MSNRFENIRKSSFTSAGRSFGMNPSDAATRERHLVECCVSRMAMLSAVGIVWSEVRVISKGALSNTEARK